MGLIPLREDFDADGVRSEAAPGLCEPSGGAPGDAGNQHGHAASPIRPVMRVLYQRTLAMTRRGIPISSDL